MIDLLVFGIVNLNFFARANTPARQRLQTYYYELRYNNNTHGAGKLDGRCKIMIKNYIALMGSEGVAAQLAGKQEAFLLEQSLLGFRR